jgi:hypothetical protein
VCVALGAMAGNSARASLNAACATRSSVHLVECQATFAGLAALRMQA